MLAFDGTAIKTGPVQDLLDRSVARHGEKVALNFLGKRWTYAQVGALVDKAAAGLQRLGVTKRTKVGLCLPNTPYSVILYFAILKAGGTVVNYSPLYVERELERQILNSGTTIMVVPDLKLIHSRVAAVAAKSKLKTIIVCPMRSILPLIQAIGFELLKRKEIAVYDRNDGVHLTFADLIRDVGPPRHVEIEPDVDLAVLQYTGGTTGIPKGAQLTHANITANADQVTRHVGCLVEGSERILGVLPLFHVFAMTNVMNIPVSLGAEIILLPRFNLKDVIATIAKRRATIFPGVPTIFSAIANDPSVTREKLASLKIGVSGGAPLPAEVRERFEALSPCKLIEGYGLSETSPVLTANPPGAIKDGSVGTALPGTILEIRDLVDPTIVLGVGEKGEVCARGPQVMNGYWHAPEESRAAFVEGAFRTGDVGYLDKDGYLFLVDRIKDVILCGGYNVYPRMIEEALYLHPAVAEAVAIGIPDPYRGQAPKAFVTLRAGQTATPEELIAFLKEHVSKVEMPKQVEIRQTLPKTLVGKLSKKELVEEEKLKAAAAA